MWRYIFLSIGVVLLLAQLVQPSRTVPATDPADDLLAVHPAPPEIQKLVVGACYDCHSYRTDHPWYAYITPVNFILQRHIEEGREVLNFSTWSAYAGGEAAAECGEEVAEGEMPPPEYARMHDHARISATEKQQLIAFFDALPAARGGSSRSDHH
jgi:hypothetical protein